MIIASVIFSIFVISLGGLIFILARKISVLVVLPQDGSVKGYKGKFMLAVESKAKEFFIFFEKQIFLHKFLLWIKIMVVKVETKIDQLLHKVRRRAQEVNKKVSGKK